MCDAVDTRFCLEHTHYRRLEEKHEHKDDHEVSEELKAAKKLETQAVNNVNQGYCKCGHLKMFATTTQEFPRFAVAPRLAGKRMAYVSPSCPWMARRRCFHAVFAIPQHAERYFSAITVENGATTMQCRRLAVSMAVAIGCQLWHLTSVLRQSQAAQHSAVARASFQACLPLWSS